jgi:hypothetical protein
MEFDEAMKTFDKEEDFLKDVPEKKSRFDKLMVLIMKENELEMTKVINEISRFEIKDWIDKLKRYKYAKYPLTKVAIAKLKWRRGW